MAVDVDSIEPRDEVDQDVVDAFRNLLQQCSGYFGIRWILGEVYGNEKLFSFSIDITDINTTLIGEKDPVTLYIPCQLGAFKVRNFSELS